MVITKRTVGEKLLAYLNSEIILAQLVDWAENTFIDDDCSLVLTVIWRMSWWLITLPLLSLTCATSLLKSLNQFSKISSLPLS